MSKDSVFLKIANSSNEWLAYIDSLGTPKNDYERTKYHYDCLYLYSSKNEMVVYQIISLLLFPLSFFCMCVSSLLTKRGKNIVDCIILTGENYTNITSIDSILPDELLKQYSTIKVIHQKKRRTLLFTGLLSSEILKLIFTLMWKYPLKFEMNFSIFTHLATVNKYIKQYRPKAIATIAGENDYSSSLISYYCESNNIDYICIMHGEYFLTPCHAFVRFSKFYVWDKFYIQQFSRSKSPIEMFRVYEPKRFKMQIQKNNEKYYVGYYLQDFNEEQMISIRANLRKLVVRGYRCKIRPHKRASDLKCINKIFQNENGIDIENVEIPIEESFSNCKYIVSMYSTVISEALYNGFPVLIDDISARDLYESLNNVMYINLHRVPGRLSDLI